MCTWKGDAARGGKVARQAERMGEAQIRGRVRPARTEVRSTSPRELPGRLGTPPISPRSFVWRGWSVRSSRRRAPARTPRMYKPASAPMPLWRRSCNWPWPSGATPGASAATPTEHSPPHTRWRSTWNSQRRSASGSETRMNGSRLGKHSPIRQNDRAEHSMTEAA